MKRVIIVIVSVLILLVANGAVAFADDTRTHKPSSDNVPPPEASGGITRAQDVTAGNPNAKIPSIDAVPVPPPEEEPEPIPAPGPEPSPPPEEMPEPIPAPGPVPGPTPEPIDPVEIPGLSAPAEESQDPAASGIYN